MLTTTRARLTALVATGALALGAGSAQAATQQEGLVNVSLTDTTVQVPVAVAANICNVNANVIATGAFDGSDQCDAASKSKATDHGGSGGSTKQSGLINVSLTDTTVQVPIGIAANICNVNANVISSLTFDANDKCTAVTDATATG